MSHGTIPGDPNTLTFGRWLIHPQGSGAVAPWAVLAAALLAGAGLRLAICLQNASFWFDEVLFATGLETYYPDAQAQTSPPLFMWIERGCRFLFGHSEASLRLPSLAAGLILLVVIAALGFRIGGPWLAAAATAAAAISPNLCRYSNELKPYGMDALVCAALILAAIPFVMGRGSRFRLVLLGIAGIAGIFLSSSAIFVLTGIAAALFVRGWQGDGLGRPMVLSSIWAAAFLIAYRLVYGALSGSAYLQQFWAGALLSRASLSEMVRRICEGLTVPAFGLDDGFALLSVAGVGLLVLGTRAMFRREGLAGVALYWIPALCAVGAALAGKWFVVMRLMLFLAPLMIVLAVLGALEIARWIPRHARARIAWILWLLLLLPMKYTFWRVRHVELESNRSMVELCLREAKPGDVVYVYPRGVAPWIYYSTRWDGDHAESVRMLAISQASGANSGNTQSRGRPVLHEGFDWRFERAGRIELLGIPTGIQSTMSGYAGNPDPGWAENETARLAAERAASRFWIFVSEYQPQALASLLERLRRQGFVQDRVYTGNRTLVYSMHRATG